MAVIGINYDEGSKAKDLGYESVYFSYGRNRKEKLFDSGDFVKDWYDAMKFYLNELNDKYPHLMGSSSCDHFIMDGAKFDSMYLGYDEEKEEPVLSPNYGDGMELFVKEGTTPTWHELRKLCGDEKTEK